ncbi:alpha/beta hydrolase [Amycolatopsis sp. RM579]|uniref:Alpha/beta hydrolase n=1 Tax=Amycolatopsis pithecellobii TaxID=664692 RepID=A0A6N7Z9V5_9PSEU|nr:alpha/beta hydrolase [Amycolatopsis pithecellobii]
MIGTAELKQFARLHVRSQNISGGESILARISDDDAWVSEWSAEGERLRAKGKLLRATSCFVMARFPYVDGVARRAALERAIETFAHWAGPRGLERVEIPVPGGRVRCWAAGLSATRPRPLVLLCGGIVSVKEQWAPALLALRRMGFAGVVAELPGVGENPLPYDADSWRMFPAVLDALAGRADVSHTYAIALSFSGHLALRCAAEDVRLRGIVTAGAPVAAFFTDLEWQRRLPAITAETLRHLIGRLPPADWALPREALTALTIPVAATISTRDEIIPPADGDALRTAIRLSWTTEHDDVHGSPHHVRQTRLWSMLAILRMHGAPVLPRLALGTALKLIRPRSAAGRDKNILPAG